MRQILSVQEFERTIDKNKLRSLQIISFALVFEIFILIPVMIFLSTADYLNSNQSSDYQIFDILTILYLLFVIFAVYFTKLYYESYFKKNSMSKFSARNVNNIMSMNRNNDFYFNLIHKAFLVHIVILSVIVTCGLVIWIISSVYLSNEMNSIYLFNCIPAIIFVIYVLYYFPRKQRIVKIYEKYFLNYLQQ